MHAAVTLALNSWCSLVVQWVKCPSKLKINEMRCSRFNPRKITPLTLTPGGNSAVSDHITSCFAALPKKILAEGLTVAHDTFQRLGENQTTVGEKGNTTIIYTSTKPGKNGCLLEKKQEIKTTTATEIKLLNLFLFLFFALLRRKRRRVFLLGRRQIFVGGGLS